MVIKTTDSINLVWKDYQIVFTANFTKIKCLLSSAISGDIYLSALSSSSL